MPQTKTKTITAQQVQGVIEAIENGDEIGYSYSKAREDAVCDYNDGSSVSACPYPEGSMRRAVYEATWFHQRGYIRGLDRQRTRA